MAQVKLSDFVVQSIAAAGVRHIFLLTGGGAMHLNDSLADEKAPQYICNLHEQACAIAAEAYGKVDNTLGAAMVTVGPGGTNTITGVAGAYLDSTPCIFISGQVKRADLKEGRGLRNSGVQEIDIIALVSPITKYAVTINDPASIRYHLEKALYLAKSGRPGPVWIDIPLDVQAAQIDPASQKSFVPEPSTGSCSARELENIAAKVVDLISKAERPFLFFGNGVRLANSILEFEQLIAALKLPFGLTWPAMDLAPETHPLLVGRPGPMASRGANFAMQNSDLLIMIGARMDLVLTAFAPKNLARAAKKIMLDIDPQELKKLEPHIDVPVCADAKDFMAALLVACKQGTDKPTNPKTVSARNDWLTRCQEWKVKYPLITDNHRKQDGLVSTFYFTEELCRQLPEGALICPGSSGNAIETLLLAFQTKKNQRIFNTTALGPMGFGIASAIGACLARNKVETICVEGDGSFHMNAQELETITRLSLPIKIFVVNNDGYGSIKASQKVYFGRLVGADSSSGLTLPSITKIAAAYGIESMSINSQSEVRSGIQKALAHSGPIICEVIAIPDEAREPRVSSKQKPDGSMTSMPLEDLSPFLPRDEFKMNMIIPPLEESNE